MACSGRVGSWVGVTPYSGRVLTHPSPRRQHGVMLSEPLWLDPWFWMLIVWCAAVALSPIAWRLYIAALCVTGTPFTISAFALAVRLLF
jgi:hypothetical protein